MKTMNRSRRLVAGVAMAALLVVATWWPSKRNGSSPRGEYAEFGECPMATATIADCVYSATWRLSSKWTEVIDSMETVLQEMKIAFNLFQIAPPEIEVSLESDPREVNGLGDSCYIGSSEKHSVFTRELTAMPIVQNPINSKTSSEVSVDSANSTNHFYEQIQLKNCLA